MVDLPKIDPAISLKIFATTNNLPNIITLINNLSKDFKDNPRYKNFIDTLTKEVNVGERGEVLKQLNADLNPRLLTVLTDTIKNNPDRVAAILDDYNAEKITLVGGLNAINTPTRRTPPPKVDNDNPAEKPASSRQPSTSANAQSSRPAAATQSYEDRLNNFREGMPLSKVTREEESYLNHLIDKETKDGGELTKQEKTDLIKEMGRLERNGNQLTEAQRDLVKRLKDNDQPQQQRELPSRPSVAAGSTSAAASTDSSPTPIVKLDEETYKGIIDLVAEQMATEFKDFTGERGGPPRIPDWQDAMKKPDRMNQFIRQYNGDPEFKQSFDELVNEMNELSEKSKNGIGKALGDFDITGGKGRMKGIVRDLLDHPDNLLSKQYLRDTKEKIKDIGDPIKGILQSFAGMFGFDGMDKIHQMLGGFGDFIKSIGSWASNLMNGGGFSMAGNGLGGLFGGLGNSLMASLDPDEINRRTGGYANTPPEEPAPARQMAQTDTTRTPNPSLGAGPTGAPTVGA